MSTAEHEQGCAIAQARAILIGRTLPLRTAFERKYHRVPDWVRYGWMEVLRNGVEVSGEGDSISGMRVRIDRARPAGIEVGVSESL